MISSQSVPLLAILASSLTLTCLSLIKSTLYPNLVIFISETSVEFVIFFLFLQPLLLQIHLFPANLTIAIHFTLASHKQISTNFNAFKIIGTCHYKYFKISTHHTNTQKTTLASYQTKNRLQNLSSHIQNTYKSQPTYLYNSLSFPSHSVSTRSSDSLVLSIPYVRSSLGKRAFSVIGPRLWNSLPLIPETHLLYQYSVPDSNTPLQNCVPSLGSFPSPWTVYPDFDSCYSHFMPYRMTPSVRHRAIEVHYYYYYYYTACEV